MSTHFLIFKTIIIIIRFFETITAAVAIKSESRAPRHKRGNSGLETSDTTNHPAPP
jgi:hypothetical protein